MATRRRVDGRVERMEGARDRARRDRVDGSLGIVQRERQQCGRHRRFEIAQRHRASRRWKDDTRIGCERAATAARRSADRARRDRNPGSPGRFLISTFTPSASHASRAASRYGTNAGRSAASRSTIARPSGSWASWWTARAPSAVRPHVELDPVGPEHLGPAEGGHGVLRRTRAEAPRWATTRRHARIAAAVILTQVSLPPETCLLPSGTSSRTRSASRQRGGM